MQVSKGHNLQALACSAHMFHFRNRKEGEVPSKIHK